VVGRGHLRERTAEGENDEGECDEYGMTFALDSGVPIIETGHALSENIGLRNFAERLRTDLPDIEVQFFADTSPFVYM